MTKTKTKTKIKFNKNILIALLLVWVVGLDFDFYLPGLPLITTEFKTSDNISRLSVPLFLIGLGLGQFVFGLLVDLWCRKKVIILSLLLLCINLIFFIFLKNNIHYFNILRLSQGFCAAGSAIGAKVMITDTFTGKTRERWYGVILSFWAFSFAISPLISSQIIHHFGWRMSFVALLIYAIFILVISCFLLSETRPKKIFYITDENKDKNKNKLYKNIKSIYSHPFFIFGLVCMCFEGSFLFLNYKMSPFIIEVGLNYSVQQYGYFAFLMSFFYFLGSVSNTVLVSYISAHKIMLTANIFLIILSIIFTLFGVFFGLTIWGFVIPILGMMFCLALYFNNLMTKTVNLIPSLVGTANAIIFLAYYLLVGFYLLGASKFPIDTQIPIGISFLISSLGIFLMYLFGNIKEKAKL